MSQKSVNPSQNKGKVLLAMSGGVDSSVAAALLQRDGYDVVGCFMRLGSDDSLEAADGYDNLSPQAARQAACDPARPMKKASGHYAQVQNGELRRGLDLGKDQSYVLFGSPRDRLNHMLLPIGGMQKSAVRQLADDFDLPVFNKPDSQEICFVPDNDYAKLVERRTEGGFDTGKIVDTDGNELGQHPGQQHFTLGQRRGVGVALGYPIYVVDKDPVANTVTVGGKADLMSSGCTANQTNWLIDDVPTDWRECEAKVRYNSDPVPARVRAFGDDALEVAFIDPVLAVTPGQAVVVYDGDRVMGGGWIDAAQKAD